MTKNMFGNDDDVSAPLGSIVFRIDPLWACPCGRLLKRWDFICDGTELQQVTCSGCHRRLLTIDRGA